MTSVEVRAGLVRALELDLVGPAEGLGDPREILAQVPSRWYLNGFLVPVDAPVSQRADEMVADELEAPETWIACHSCVTQLATRARMEMIIRTRKNQPQARALGPPMCCPMI